ncbi:Aspartic peptidase domain superfamily [Arabidopsis suecica]|uniref:Aspartic peptidase domain superfamily n=1 Tax=Arabidopsis suecica TaxID=45249 RepID=A0A8T1YQ89_ARASU|nr:Aspartic peptidase domain superfamily [Arabidopsis suecica]
MGQGIMRLIIAAIFVMVCGYEGTILPLKRMIHSSHELDLTQLGALDSARHGRMLQSPVHGAFSFPVERGTNPISRLYYTTLQIGTPPREFNVVIDTGSDVLWVSCISCVGCPLQNVTFFDPGASSSAVKLACSDKRCFSDRQKKSGCSPLESCSYKVEYGDGSVTSGYYISDLISFETVMSSNLTVKSSAPFVFGCSNLQAGLISLPETPIHGIVGLGKGRLSVVSQLSSQRLAPEVFSLCLSGGQDGGGVMVLGENRLPNTVYTPLVRSQTHYNVNLKTVAVNDLTLPIDPSIFSVATGYGTIIDSGTVLVYFPAEAYDTVIQAISNVVSLYGRPIPYKSFQCYNITYGMSSHLVVADMFPEVTLGFAGGASMVIKPEAYLFQMFPDLVNAIWCLAFRSSTSRRITIIGEVAIRDKMFVYDLDHQRIGWAEYNCSLDVTRREQNKDIINTKKSTGNSTKGGSYLTLMIYLLLHFLFSH